MSTGTRRPSLSRYPSVALERQSSITYHSSNAFFDEQEKTASSERTTFAEKERIWNTTRKLTLVSLCLVYFAATASFAILSPFFPSEVSCVIYFSPKCRLRRSGLDVDADQRPPFHGGLQIERLFFRRIKRTWRASLIKTTDGSKACAVRKAFSLHQFGPGAMAYRYVWVAFEVPELASIRSIRACLFI